MLKAMFPSKWIELLHTQATYNSLILFIVDIQTVPEMVKALTGSTEPEMKDSVIRG